jgi:hypothetical protein
MAGMAGYGGSGGRNGGCGGSGGKVNHPGTMRYSSAEGNLLNSVQANNGNVKNKTNVF